MAKQKVIQTNFTGGELSPLMLGRVDVVKYQNGAALLQNMIVRQQGGAWKREGTYFVKAVKDSSAKTRLIDFEYSDIQPYILEFGNLYFHIFYDGGYVETAPLSGVPLEIATLYTTTELFELTYTQSADVLYIFHKNHQTRKIRRLGANSWDIVNCAFTDGPYLNQNPVECNVTLSGLINYANAVSTTGIFNAVISKNNSIISVALVAGNWQFTTAAAHTHATGTVVNISGVGFQIAYQGTTKYIYITGQYAITNVSGSVFRITAQPTWFPTAGGTVWTVAGSLVQTLTVAHKYIDYRVNGVWLLSEILTVTDNTHATVIVNDNVKTDFPAGAYVAWLYGPTTLSGNVSGIFTINDPGKYIRDSTGAWWLITGIANDSDCYMLGLGYNLSVLAYTYATTAVTVDEPVRQGIVTSVVALFASTDVNRPMRFNYGGKWAWGLISGYVSTTVVFIGMYTPVPLDTVSLAGLYNNGITSIWKIGAWSTTTGFARTGIFHEQRLWFGGSNTEPLTLWSSQISDYENMAPTEYDSLVLDTSAINYTLVADKANPILWLMSTNSLLIGTLGSEWLCKAATSGSQPITPTNINITPQTNNGSLSGALPIKLGNAVAFVQKAGRKVIEVQYDFQQDSFVGRNMCVVSEHILRRGGKGKLTAYQKEPNNILWVLLNDGTLAACTYDKDQQVMAWHQHVVGGNGIVESIVVTNSAAGTEDLLYMIVKRTINGATKRYIEYLTPDFFPTSDTDITLGFFLDCGLSLTTGMPVTTVSGVGHLEGESVDVVVDGIYIGKKTVSSGIVTLGMTATVSVHVGYKYSGVLKTLPQEGASPTGGTSQGKIKRAARTMIRVFNTRSFKYGTNLQTLDVRNIVDGNGTVVNKMNSDDLGINIPMNYNYTSQFYLVQDLPYPMVILAIAPDVEVTT